MTYRGWVIKHRDKLHLQNELSQGKKVEEGTKILHKNDSFSKQH